MRSDFHKIIIEKERRNSSDKSKKYGGKVSLKTDFEEHETGHRATNSKIPYNGVGKSKELSDRLHPLRQYLFSKIGSRWDEVYSEVKKIIPKGLHGDHIWSHITQMIAVDCEVKDGIFYDRSDPYRYADYKVGINGLFVHPETGIISLQVRKRKEPAPEPVKEIIIKQGGGKVDEDIRFLLFDNGIWYAVTKHYRSITFYDMATNKITENWNWYPDPPKQLSSKTLRKYNIKNKA